MKAYVILVLMFILVCTAFATTNLGKDITLKEATPISKILDKPDDFNGKKVLIEGTIVGVCKKRGCWIELAGDKEYQKILVKVEDGVIVFPVEANGHKAKVEGIVEIIQTESKENKKDDCADHEQKEGESCKTGSICRIMGLGAVIEGI